MTDRKLMQQVMENICGAKLCEINSMSSRQEMLRLLDEAVDILRDRLAQTEQGPVAWMYVNPDGECEQIEYEVPPNDPSVTPLYTAPRPWVGLTKEEAKEISMANRPYVIDMIAALEARLKEKNT